MRILAQREHSVAEVRQKLAQRGFDKERSNHYISLFQQQGLLSDARFAEAYVHSRIMRGYGPRYIEQALSAKQVAAEQAALALESYDGWSALAREVREKRFGERLPRDFKEQAKQMRFLQQRGFESEHIRKAMAEEV